MSKTRVFVPAGVIGGFPGHTSQTQLGQTTGRNFAITTSALRANIPGVDLRQVQETNGVAVDVGAPSTHVDMNPRTYVLKK